MKPTASRFGGVCHYAMLRALYTSPGTANKHVSEMLTQRYQFLFGGKIFFHCEIVSTLDFRAQWPLSIYLFFSGSGKKIQRDTGITFSALGEQKFLIKPNMINIKSWRVKLESCRGIFALPYIYTDGSLPIRSGMCCSLTLRVSEAFSRRWEPTNPLKWCVWVGNEYEV